MQNALGLWLIFGMLTPAFGEQTPAESSLRAVVPETPEQKAKVEALARSYPLKTCFVSGDRLDDPVDALYGDRLLRFCCKGCLRSFNKRPAKYLPKLDSPEKTAS